MAEENKARALAPKVIVMPDGWKQKLKVVRDDVDINKSYLEIVIYNDQDMSTYGRVKINLGKLANGTEFDLSEAMAVAMGLNS